MAATLVGHDSVLRNLIHDLDQTLFTLCRDSVYSPHNYRLHQKTLYGN